MTVGIVSGLGRTMDSLHDAPGGGVFSAGDIIQTDAAINPGNSGGPLLNMNGEVVGVNRAIYTTSFSNTGEPLNSGLGFAISVNIVKRVVPSLISEGKYDYPYVGISSVDDLSLVQKEALGLTSFSGVYVHQISPGSPADRAGLIDGNRPTELFNLQAGGDLIVAVDGIEVQTFSDFIGYLIKHKSPGDTAVLSVVRDDQEIDVVLTLDKRPSP
jgi:2-alkenal reductase